LSNGRLRGVGGALVIGEQVMANSLRDCLRLDFGVPHVRVASFFRMDPALSEEGDLFLDSEEALTALMILRSFDLVVGDPLFRELVHGAESSVFVPFPHLAVSSRLHWDGEFDYVGENGYSLFRDLIPLSTVGQGRPARAN